MLRDFLRTVLPEDGPVYFAVTLPPKRSKVGPQHYPCNHTIDALAEKLLELDHEGRQVYFATAAYQQAKCMSVDGKTRRRVALKRQTDENLMRLLLRFDEALVRALDHDAVVDEINPRR